MIEFNACNPTVKILNESVFTFYLTGSRFFGTSNEHSDYDFFCRCRK